MDSAYPKTVADVAVVLTTTDGSTSVRNTYFVFEGGSWLHRFSPEEYDLLASVSTASASASAGGGSSTSPSPSPSSGVDEFDCSDFDTQEQAQQTYEWDTSDPNGLDGPPERGIRASRASSARSYRSGIRAPDIVDSSSCVEVGVYRDHSRSLPQHLVS